MKTTEDVLAWEEYELGNIQTGYKFSMSTVDMKMTHEGARSWNELPKELKIQFIEDDRNKRVKNVEMLKQYLLQAISNNQVVTRLDLPFLSLSNEDIVRWIEKRTKSEKKVWRRAPRPLM